RAVPEDGDDRAPHLAAQGVRGDGGGAADRGLRPAVEPGGAAPRRDRAALAAGGCRGARGGDRERARRPGAGRASRACGVCRGTALLLGRTGARAAGPAGGGRVSRRPLLALFLLTLPLVTPRVRGADEIEYFSYLRSAVFDHDLEFGNEYQWFYDHDPQGL